MGRNDHHLVFGQEAPFQQRRRRFHLPRLVLPQTRSRRRPSFPLQFRFRFRQNDLSELSLVQFGGDPEPREARLEE